MGPLSAPAIAGLAAAAPATVRAVGTASSAFASLLRRGISGMMPNDGSRGTAPPGEDLSSHAAGEPSAQTTANADARFDRLLTEFADELRRVLELEGIATDPPVRVELDEFGQLRTVGEHPDKADIDAILALRPELAARFRVLAATGRLARLESGSAASTADSAAFAGAADSPALEVTLSATGRDARFA
ncbi:MAG: hypothetical protein KY476_17430 [Planctomycetes bacterium]|nr:hypothetical protein [Planctomycetota bacterium]